MSSDSPSPPYSSGIIRPKIPISFMPSTMSVGYSSLCSSSVATGMICSFDELAHELDELVLLLGEAVRGLESGHA